MKAQISVEYFISLILFIGFIAYIFFQVLRFTPVYLTEIKNEEIRSEVYQISELLVNDHGEPANWDLGTINRLGLSDETQNKTNLLSRRKINLIESRCSAGGYSDIKTWIGTEHDFTIILTDLSTSSILINCKPDTFITRTINATVRRVVAFDSGNYGELIVEVW